MKIKLIYLAAGNSRRFRKNGENKLFYKLDGKPMYRHLLDRLVSVCERQTDWEIIVVTQYEEILGQIQNLPVKGVFSKDSYKGASFSIKAGICAAGKDADAYAFFVADQPYFTAKSVEGFLKKMEADAGQVPGCVCWKEKVGNPVWFPAKYAGELLELEGDTGGRKVFRRYQERAVFYEVDSEEELEDLDYAPDTFKAYCMENGTLERQESLLGALKLTGNGKVRIAAVGAGGKTSLLKKLAEKYKEEGQKPLLVTTTHMKKEESPFFTLEDSLEKILEIREKECMVVAGKDAGNGRIKSLSKTVMEEIWKLDAPVLVEADGARMLPVKVPGEKEPVIPAQTDLVLSVYGLDAIGRRLKDCCFRPELATGVLGKSQEDILTAEDVIKLASSRCGGKKGLLPGMEYVVVLNKAENEERLKIAERIARCLEKDFGEKVLVTSFR